ncbi:nitroreductase [Clostridia bacterium]|nr:nitroreductase [Clostridia bacterium]
MNETLKTIASRYSCRNFTGEIPSSEQLQAIADAAIQSPSANNSQRWKVIVIRNKELIGELETEAMKSIAELPDKAIYDSINSRGGKLFYNAPCIVFVPIEPSNIASASLDCGIVSQNIALAAESLGLGSCICGLARFAFSESKEAYFKEKLNFPEGYEFGMSVLIGKAVTVTSAHNPNREKITYID